MLSCTVINRYIWIKAHQAASLTYHINLTNKKLPHFSYYTVSTQKLTIIHIFDLTGMILTQCSTITSYYKYWWVKSDIEKSLHTQKIVPQNHYCTFGAQYEDGIMHTKARKYKTIYGEKWSHDSPKWNMIHIKPLQRKQSSRSECWVSR